MKYLVILAILSATVLTQCQQKKETGGENGKTETSSEKPQWVTTPSGLKYIIWKQGEGEPAVPGKLVRVHYVGMLTDSTIFDSSYKRGEPLPFTLGAGQVIKGWEEGIGYLREGAKATLIIPPSLGYGNNEIPNLIPANSTLIFKVELVSVE